MLRKISILAVLLVLAAASFALTLKVLEGDRWSANETDPAIAGLAISGASYNLAWQVTDEAALARLRGKTLVATSFLRTDMDKAVSVMIQDSAGVEGSPPVTSGDWREISVSRVIDKAAKAVSIRFVSVGQVGKPGLVMLRPPDARVDGRALEIDFAGLVGSAATGQLSAGWSWEGGIGRLKPPAIKN